LIITSALRRSFSVRNGAAFLRQTLYAMPREVSGWREERKHWMELNVESSLTTTSELLAAQNWRALRASRRITRANTALNKVRSMPLHAVAHTVVLRFRAQRMNHFERPTARFHSSQRRGVFARNVIRHFARTLYYEDQIWPTKLALLR
jgi:hypothetical protein